jgi:hypothetical protein
MTVYSKVDVGVLEAILAGSTRVTRRLEIYESDGTTIWLGSEAVPRMISGSVTVDYTRAERRAVDLTLDNSDGTLVHDPNGFWYDKVLKVYRGIEYPNTRLQPNILVIEDAASFLTIVPLLKTIGFVNILVDSTVTTLDQMNGFDIIVDNGGAGSITKSALMIQAYAAGYNVMTVGATSTGATIPLISATVSKSDALAWQINPYNTADHYLRDGWGPITMALNTVTGQHVTGLSTGTKAVGTWTDAGNFGYTAMLQENGQGARWFHLQPAAWPVNNTNFKQLALNAINWLYSYADIRTYEVQVGEFLIDQINEDSFPKTISVTGRDYTKKILRSKFSNSLTFTAGGSLDTLITALAANAGIYKRIEGATGVSINADITFAREDDRWKAISDICTAASIEVFFNAEGYLVTRPFLDPVTSPATVSLAVGEPDGNLVSYSKSSDDSRIYNRVVVTGEDADTLGEGVFYQAVAENNEPTSPTRIDRLGQIDYFYTSAFFTSNAQCQQTADNYLSVMALESFNLDFSSLVFPWLEAGDIAEFTDVDNSDFPTRFLLTNFTIPLDLTAMSGTAKRVGIVGSPSVPGNQTADDLDS